MPRETASPLFFLRSRLGRFTGFWGSSGGYGLEGVMELGVSEHFLHVSDWNHPSPCGSFLSAAILFATVFEESAGQVEYDWILDGVEAAAFRAIGSRTILDNLAL